MYLNQDYCFNLTVQGFLIINYQLINYLVHDIIISFAEKQKSITFILFPNHI